MKNSKYLLLAAIAAATASLSSCSDNDVLEGAKDTGIPFTVTATTNSGGSRGSDISSLSNFQLWGFGTEQDTHFDGDNFTLKSGTTFQSTDGTPNWPNTNDCVFYAISDNTSTMDYGVPAGSPGVNSSKAEIRNGSFDYTIPTDIANQKDLLVAAATGNSINGVQMKFDHALTAAKLCLALDPTKTAAYDAYLASVEAQKLDPSVELVFSGYIVKINKITIHNIKVSGTYEFNGTEKDTDGNYINGSWKTSSGVLGDYVIDFGDNPYVISTKIGSTYNELLNINNDNSNLYFIPQIISYWNIVPNDPTGYTKDTFDNPGTENNYSYVEFEAMAFNYVLQDAVGALDGKLSEEGWSQDTDGNYFYNNKEIAKADGLITDVNTAIQILGSDIYGETQLYDESVFTANFDLTDFDHTDGYGVFYSPFKATLNVNGNRIFKINVDQGVIKANDCSALFGVSAEGGA